MKARDVIAAVRFRSLTESQLDQVANRAVAVLAQAGIPHLVVGGLAVQAHGYHRTTLGVDLVVPDVQAAVAALVRAGFKRDPVLDFRVAARNGVAVDLLPGGADFDTDVRFPTPKSVRPTPVVASLPLLLSLKLAAYYGPARRVRDLADVEELILANRLPRELCGLDGVVRHHYQAVWDQAARRTHHVVDHTRPDSLSSLYKSRLTLV